MPELITRDLLTEGIRPAFQTVQLRKGYCINVRGLSIKETIIFVELRDLEDSSDLDKLGAMVDIALAVCVDDSGKALFQADDRNLLLLHFTASELASVVEAASGMDAETVPEKSESSNKVTDSA